MGLRRMFLSLVLAGASLWCLGLVQQVYSEEKAEGAGEKFAPAAPTAVLSETQTQVLADLRKAAEASSPKFGLIQERGEFLAELFNVLQYAPKVDAAAAACGRDQALELVKAGKAKDAEAVRKLLDPLGEAIRKVAAPASEATPPSEPYKPVAGVHSLMEEQQSAFDLIKRSLSAGGAEDLKKVETSALVLAELSNINRHQQKDKADYVDWATQARDTSLQLARAAAAGQADHAKGILRQLYTTCTSCHDKYQ